MLHCTPSVISSWLLGLVVSCPACLPSGIRIVTDLIAKSPRLCGTTEHFGDKIFAGKRRGGTPGLFRSMGELPQEPFSPGKESRRNKKGNPGSEGGGRLTSVVGVEYAGYGNTDYDL